MKKSVKNCRLTIVCLLGMSQITYSQWLNTGPYVYLLNNKDRVGIGTNTPAQKLQVVGDALFHGVRVGLGNGSVATNTIIGHGALFSNTTGYQNVAEGYQALYSNTTSYQNTAEGYQALFSNTTGATNTANGYQALFSNTTGFFNIAGGWRALYLNTTGFDNTAFGADALSNNTTAQENTALGTGALYSNTTGNGVTASGALTLNSNTTGDNNTATGRQALFLNTTGANNTANGEEVLYANTTGHDNTGDGEATLLTNVTGSNNTAVGSFADVSSGNRVYATAIGAGAIVNASHKMQLGSSTTVISTSGGYTIVSDGRFKDNITTDDAPGLAFINKLRPVAYNFNYKRYDDFLKKNMKVAQTANDEYNQRLTEQGRQRQVGFVAQEVYQLCQDNKFTFNGVYAPQSSDDNYSLDYSRFVVPLVKAVQELSAENDKLKEQLSKLMAAINSNNNSTATVTLNGTANVPILGQNIPNPAANSTIIPFRIPGNCSSASIVIAETGSGRVQAAIPVSCTENQLSVKMSNLDSGSYTYSLYINGKLADTKQMILAK